MGLDGVEMILAVEAEFEISISDGDAERMVTARDLIEAVCSKLDVGDDELGVGSGVSERAFFKVRSELVRVVGVERGEVRLETGMEELFPRFKGGGKWRLFVGRIGLDGVPWYGSWLSGHSAPRSVRDVVERLVERNPAWLSGYGRWSRRLVRERVREIISGQLGVRDFDDGDELVRDLGMG
ncbi:MAG: hypothetical protein ACSHX6_04550 [Akkermansiaceae bacterium]